MKMNKFQKIILLCLLFTFVFSIKVTKIEPTTVTLGERVNFTLTVEDYEPNKSYNFYLSNDDENSKVKVYCSSNYSNGKLKCSEADIVLDKKDLDNLTKTLFLDYKNTNLTVTIEKPKTLKLLNFYDDDKIYSYGISRFTFIVNFNELYKSDFSIKFGDYSITKCSLNEYYIEYINCYYEFPENSYGQTLNLKFGDEVTEYSITINAPQEFSKIYDINSYIYYNIVHLNKMFIFMSILLIKWMNIHLN